MSEVVCLGILVADVVARPVRRWPEEGKLVLVEQMELHTGGCAVNTGTALARLGIGVTVIGKVGDDPFGDFMVASLQREGIRTDGIRREPGVHTSATMVCVSPGGERSFIHYLGANAELTDTDVDFSLLKGARLLHIGSAFLVPKLDGEPLARVLRRAREMGVMTCVDTAWDGSGRWMDALAPALPYADYCVPSLEEARQITREHEPEEIARVLLAAGVKVVGIKMGDKGCYVRSATEEHFVPAFHVEAVDATGAGDAWVAGFLAGVVKGRSLKESALLGNAVGAMSVTAMGASGGIRSFAETEAFMARTPLRAETDRERHETLP
ncbi:MAG: sugar kinase [Armatimonadota bacterium]|nr:sugar kinase [Armatimonadota bacterium]